jgi:Tol biopolymer transport system component
MNLQHKLACQLVLLSFFVFAFNLNAKGNKSTPDNIFPHIFQSMDKGAQKFLKSLPAEEADWFFQDFKENLPELFKGKDGKTFLPKIHSIYQEISEVSGELKKQIELAETGDFEKRLQTYLNCCRERRKVRLAELIKNSPELVFLENKEFGNAPRLDMSMTDGPYRGKPFAAGASIHQLKLNEQGLASLSPLLINQNGMLRDLDVSFDGKRILFAQKETISADWQIYEMNLLTGITRAVTKERGIANIQPCYLPNGILFHSTRCVTVVDCNETIDAVNIYKSDLNGNNIQRLTVDQVKTHYPSLMPYGRVIYTRW